ncbi:hypothetical protein [Halalkalicoccus sp. NIPERK01]|uniref:hypothetical protein n=1 Tax=Halalkalicoccus sp. NIPERK01 TaxID=3053469 RepID=UPI00256EAA48|nr:hypothetical protein [Halalkalicoccus sp. NIPERK01]MDL5360399.1 hypothetical protein [Halalkalicoccus sp. NIPERK01]
MPNEDHHDIWIDRPTGLLTSKERDLLINTGGLGQSDETPSAERQRRARIRQRMLHSILDFAILNPPPEKLTDIFEDIDEAIDEDGKRYPREFHEVVEDDESPTLRDGIEGMFEFLFYVLGGVRPTAGGQFDECLSAGGKTAFISTLAANGVSIVPDLRLKREYSDTIALEKVREQLHQGELLLPEEYEALRHAYPEDQELIQKGMDDWRDRMVEAINGGDHEWRERHRQQRKQWRSEASEITLEAGNELQSSEDQ